MSDTLPADTLRADLLHALEFAQCANLGYETPEQMLDAYDAARAAECSAPLDRAALRQQIARALVRYDWNAGLSGRDTPSAHHYGEADAVMAVLMADEAETEGGR
ncbi:hypothetical protein [Streptomyces albidoflavus]|uniref:hypothetical protein n=1 Tax=Streptomyces albidoflavus TaxID=1886 RepID=UPI0005279957|nr:hypothetical protein [Streptomyces albidoflavus]